MKHIYPAIIFSAILLGGCSPSWKNLLVSEGNQEAAIQNAVYDFLNSVKKEKKDSVFYAYAKNINNDILGVNIYGTKDKVLISTEDSVTFSYRGLPTGYLEKNGKLFYWHETGKIATVTEELIVTLKRYNLLDTAVINVYIPARTISHGKKGVDYYFCKRNLLRYKRVRTVMAMGYYLPPKLNCK